MKKILIVSGAAGDLGRDVMKKASDSGYQPVGLDRIPSTNVRQVDLEDEQQVRETFAQISSAVAGKPIGLVNCVGKYSGLKASETTISEFVEIQMANVTTAWLCSKEFANICEDNSIIINLASISGRFGSKDVAYGTAKAAIIGLTKSLALAYGPRIRVNAVAPGVIESHMLQNIPKKRAEDYKTASILGRHGTTEEVAELIVNLVGPTSSWMTGAIIDVNGGFK
ncbi:SDR family NAD(P)-dependent oxidoreductase [Corynebacterium durum]|jgi:short-chain dehydrogenase/reductase SDR|uniref:Oxidoreductase, short chain dehydrogenase/reductase family protein n=1 Tax=Corynebacterium durum F0235 TaxID=1035195 RepID=L1MB83_9CORY|nr:SDR family oxidoreductase [Corynebacterium durum]EKX88508.1 oxidoreductase, short chain dehydrogenase/reductase family protein [Corynebacterium durum F0235]